MPKKLTKTQKEALQKHEKPLQLASRMGRLDDARTHMSAIQKAFLDDREHSRVQGAKNWYAECLLDAGKTLEAKRFFESIRECSNNNTRVYIEATTFLGICYLRAKEYDAAKELFRFVIKSARTIKSTASRVQYYKRLESRIQDECILSQLIGGDVPDFDVKEIHDEAVKLIQQNTSEDELLEYVGNALPNSVQSTVDDITDFSRKQLSHADRRRLASPSKETSKKELGKRAVAVIKRIGWKIFCDEDSEIYKLWNTKAPEVFGVSYFAQGIKHAMEDWKIGSMQVAIGLTAIALKYTCQEFCSIFKPESLMISMNEKIENQKTHARTKQTQVQKQQVRVSINNQ